MKKDNFHNLKNDIANIRQKNAKIVVIFRD